MAFHAPDVVFGKTEAPASGVTRTDDFGVGQNGVPMSVWIPVDAEPRAIVLIGHGGSQHRRAEMVETTARIISNHIPAFVVAIDGPVHGDRLVGDPGDTVQAFVQKWTSDDGGVPTMLSDWREALATVRALHGASGLPVGYYGVSMGTAYGIPLLADQPEIAAAAIGMWDAAAPKAERHSLAAPRIRCPVQFCYRQDDALFTIEGAKKLFAQIGSPNKTFVLIEGPHGETASQIELAATFLARHLGGDVTAAD